MNFFLLPLNAIAAIGTNTTSSSKQNRKIINTTTENHPDVVVAVVAVAVDSGGRWNINFNFLYCSRHE